jgi:DNA-binding NarL/FixJ family response regulator
MNKIKVAIVEDNPGLRTAMEQILQMDNRFEFIKSYTSGEAAVTYIPDIDVDIVLMDINLGGISGIEAVGLLKTQKPNIKFMMCTVYEEDEQIFDALSAGASGYILKKTAPKKLLDAIEELQNGGAPMSSQIAAKVVMAFQKKGNWQQQTSHPNEKVLDMLSPREKEIIEQLSKGLLYKEIASALFISQETVRKHVYNIYEKLHVNNRIEAVNMYLNR